MLDDTIGLFHRTRYGRHRTLIVLCLLFSIFLVFGAQAQPAKRKRRKGQVAIVAIEGAAVYKYPNFDSEIIDYLKAGTKILASRKARQGIGGFGAFYKVKLPNKKIGWMTDVDILPKYKAKSGSTQPTKQVNPDFKDAESIMENAGKDPVYFEKFVGAQLGMVQFTEKFQNRELSSDVFMFGLRGRGPGLLFDGPPLDLSFSFSVEAPSYYEEFSSGKATGFFILTDAQFPFPLIDQTNYVLSLGVGPMIAYTRFSVPVRTTEFDSQEIRLGVVSSLSFLYRIKNVSIVIDGKYHYETVDYYGATAGVLFHVK